MAREIAEGKIAREDLVAGRAPAYLALHSAAIFSLKVNISESDPTPGFPATLLLDVKHFTILNHQLERVINGFTLTAIANHVLVGNDPRPSQEKRMVLTQLARLFAANNPALVNEFETIVAKLRQQLDMANLLPDEGVRDSFFKTLQDGFSNKSHAVRQLM